MGEEAPEDDSEIVKTFMESVGIAFEQDEKLLDSITGLAGSGPAYVFEFTCALEEAARAIGLPGKLGREIALGTVTGAAHLMQDSEMHPQELRDQVTSPNGTTQAALESFSADKLRTIVRHAVEAAKARSIELSHEYLP